MKGGCISRKWAVGLELRELFNVPLSASCKEAQDPATMHWRRGGREKQLKDDAHQRNSKVEMSLE